MKVYAKEILDGVSELVSEQCSIAYCSPAIVCNNLDIHTDILNKIKAESNPNQIDLYYLKSILVSTGWNKNDDVFDNQETWAARSTPEDKQFNFMHNENDIIGHITGSYIVDKDGNTVASEEEAPQQFDIITEAVLYNSWTNPENRERMKKIISEIEEGKWFVSMECLFAGFDYAVIDSNGKSRVLARNEHSSFLTKHLRAYGGTGEYEGYKIGRSLRSISFSGKGLVSKPANPRSVILNSSKAFSVSAKDTEPYVISNVSKGEFQMQDNDLEKQLADLQNELASSKEENAVVRAEIESAKTEIADKIAAFETSVAKKDEVISHLEEAARANQAKLSELEEALSVKEKQLAETCSAMDEMKKKEKDRMRKEKLVMAGFEDAEAEESLSFYDNLDDSAFEAIVAMYNKKMKSMKKMDKKMMEEKASESEADTVDATSEANAEEEVSDELFDGVNSTEAALVDASSDKDELESTRASVAKWLTENVLRK
jgi:hypothetical protein